MSDQRAADTTARERWFETHGDAAIRSDRADVRVWWPESVPTARLQTVTVGSGDERRDVLPKGPLLANLRIGSVDIGGRLDDLEALVECAREALAEQREYADHLAERAEADAHEALRG